MVRHLATQVTREPYLLYAMSLRLRTSDYAELEVNAFWTVATTRSSTSSRETWTRYCDDRSIVLQSEVGEEGGASEQGIRPEHCDGLAARE